MKKAILNGMTVLFAILLFSSCDALIEDALQDRDTTTLETERDTYVTPDESTEEPTDPSTEIPTDELTEVSTKAPTEEPTDSIPDETLSPLVFDDAALNEVVDQLRTQGYDMEQLTFRHADDYAMTYRYEMTLSDRVFHPGETIEIKVSEIYHYGSDWGDNLQEYMEITVFNVAMEAMSLSDSPKEYRFHMKDSDTICFEIPEDIEQGAYMIYVDINDTFSYLAPIIIY